MDYDEIMEMMITELTERGLREQRKENTELDAQIKELVALGDELRSRIKALDAQALEKLERYLDSMNLIAGSRMRYLYLQGAKDCVRLLKSLRAI